MIVGFFTDHKFFHDSSKIVYTSGTLNSEFWGRFLDNGAHHVIVVGRNGGALEDNSARASAENVSFRCCESLSNLAGLLGVKDNEIVRSAVRESSKVVARLPSEIGYRAIGYAKQFGKLVACEVVACPKDTLQYYGCVQARLYAPLAALRMKKYVARSGAALYVTQSVLQSRYPNSWLTAFASNVDIMDTEENCLPHRIARFRERACSGALKICLVGTLENKSKGVDVAIYAIAGKPHQLTVIGRGDPQEYVRLAQRVGVTVEFNGFISDRDALLSELDDADIYVEPSFQEGLSRATLEAMSRGCPAITSSAGGFPEVTHPFFIHKPGDYRALGIHINNGLDETTLSDLIVHSIKTSQKYLRSKMQSKRSSFYRSFLSCVSSS